MTSVTSISTYVPSAGQTVAGELASFAYEVFRDGELPADVLALAEQILIDQIGLQIGCSRLPWSEAVFRYIESLGGQGGATVVARGLRTNAENAAFVNAAFGHGQDMDDTCTLVQTHAGAVIVPVALAIAEETGATGEQLLRAIALGLEVMLRAAYSVSPDCLRHGHHTPPAAGPFGAAIAAGLLLGLSPAALEQALGVAGSFCGGLTEYTQSGGSVKRIHTAIPTIAGVRAARFAQAGITGPLTVFEGIKGFCRVFAADPHPERLTDGLGTEWVIREVGFKLYNCCYFIHPPIEAALSIVQSAHLDPADIKSISVGTSAHGVTHVGAITHPDDAVGGQFSLAFTLALVLLRGLPDIGSYTPEQLADRELHDFADKVTVHEDTVATAEYPRSWGGIVRITTTSGAEHESRVRYQRGTPQNPIGPADLWAKFNSNVEPIIGLDRAARLGSVLGQVRELAAVGVLAEALA
jgi:2-methylcitrate dehydratase PrpD